MRLDAYRDHIRDVFQNELAEIRDVSLRDRTTRTWARAMELSGIEYMPYVYLPRHAGRQL